MFFFLRKKYDIIYAFFYSIDLAKFASWITSQKKAILIVHIADHTHSFVNNPVFVSILQQSSKLCCIGQNMKEYYEDIFKKPFDVFHNLADEEYLPLTNNLNSTFCESKPLKILFIGSLFESLHKGTINVFCKAVDELNDEGYFINFELYGQIVPKSFLKNELSSSNINHHGTIPTDERFSVMSQHHCFIIPSSFTNTVKNEYQYSIPTKLPELLLSGRPVIIYGPKEMEAYRYCFDNNCGNLIDDNSKSSIKTALIDLYLKYPKHYKVSLNTSHKLVNKLSIRDQIPRFKSFILN